MNGTSETLSMPHEKSPGTTGDRSSALRSGVVRRVLVVFTFVVIAVAMMLGSYRLQGNEGLMSSGAGLAYGSFLAFLAWLLARRQARAQSQIVFHVLLGSFLTMFLFAVGVLVIAWVWRTGVLAASLSALVVYLFFKFYMVFTMSGRLSRAPHVETPKQE